MPYTGEVEQREIAGVVLPEILYQVPMSKVPTDFWDILSEDVVTDIPTKEFLEKYLSSSNDIQRWRMINTRRRIAIDNLRRRTCQKAMIMGNNHATPAEFGLLKIDYISETRGILEGDFYHGNKDVATVGTRIHSVATCSKCREEILGECSLFEKLRRRMSPILNNVIVLANLIILIGIIFMIPASRGEEILTKHSTAVLFEGFDCNHLEYVKIIKGGIYI